MPQNMYNKDMNDAPHGLWTPNEDMNKRNLKFFVKSKYVCVVAKVYRRIMYTLAPKFEAKPQTSNLEANVYSIPKLGG